MIVDTRHLPGSSLPLITSHDARPTTEALRECPPRPELAASRAANVNCAG